MDQNELELWRQYKRRPTVKRRNELVERYMSVAKHLAHKLFERMPSGSAIEFDDLYSAAYQGLLDAVPRFDPERGYAPATFLGYRIRGKMADYLRENDIAPRLARQRTARVERWEQTVLGRTATDDEIQEHFGFTVRRQHVLSLDSTLGSHKERDVTLADLLASDAARPESRFGDVAEILRGLDQRERLIVVLYHCEHWTMRQIGETLGLSESRVSQQMKLLMHRLRASHNVAA